METSPKVTAQSPLTSPQRQQGPHQLRGLPQLSQF